MGDAKKPWQSKTLWIGLVVAASGFFPPVHTWITHNPELFSTACGLVFAGLRLITNKTIDIGDGSVD